MGKKAAKSMKVLITGVCGFVGSTLAIRLLESWRDQAQPLEILGIDNFSRPGSETNKCSLKKRGIKLFYGDLRSWADIEGLPAVDWVIDAAAYSSVLSGIDGKLSSRQIIDNNLQTTLNLLEFCKNHQAGFILLSTSRVYSIRELNNLPIAEKDDAFSLDCSKDLPVGVSASGVNEMFPTDPPISLYGVTKLASEMVALEYGEAFGFPVWINRCGVLAGAGQFGRPDQGIFTYWIHSYMWKKPLKYIGFGGNGYQVRDCFHPHDLIPLIKKQFNYSEHPPIRIFNLGGGPKNSISLFQLSCWCKDRFGFHTVDSHPTDRSFDIPWMIMDSNKALSFWSWKPQIGLEEILQEIADHAAKNKNWLELSAAL